MSGGPPNYGFSSGAPYYPGASAQYPGAPPTYCPGAAPTHFGGVPQSQFPSAPPTHFGAAPTHFAGGAPTSFAGGASSYFPGSAPTHFTTSTSSPQFPGMISSTTNYYPAGETHFTSAAAPSVHSSFPQGYPQGPSWVSWTRYQALPANAVEAGYDVDGTKIYVGRLSYAGDILPAKVIPQKNVAYISYDGKEIGFPNCEILCQMNVNWVQSSNGSVSSRAIEVGRTARGEPLYAGRVQYKNAVTVGKIHSSHGCCFIPFNGVEMRFRDYEVLTS